MIESILTIIDKVIDILDRRAKTSREIYEKQIEPLFSEIILIHKDYRGIFDDADNLINDESVSLDDVIGVLKERRKDLEVMREKVTALGRVLRENKKVPKTALNFFESIHWYFDTASDNDSFMLCSSTITNLMQVLKKLDSKDENLRKHMKHEMWDVKHSLENRWNNLLQAYAEARVELLK